MIKSKALEVNLADYHVDVAVEMHARPRASTFQPGDDVGAGVTRAVTRRALTANIGDREAAAGQAVADQAGARPVGVPRRIDGRDPHQRLGQRDQLRGFSLDALEQSVEHAQRPLARGNSAAPSRAARTSGSVP